VKKQKIASSIRKPTKACYPRLQARRAPKGQSKPRAGDTLRGRVGCGQVRSSCARVRALSRLGSWLAMEENRRYAATTATTSPDRDRRTRCGTKDYRYPNGSYDTRSLISPSAVTDSPK